MGPEEEQGRVACDTGEMFPAQFNLFTGEAEPLPIDLPQPPAEGQVAWVGEEVSVAKAEDGSQIVLSGAGLFVGKKSERMVIRKGKKVCYQFPLFRLSEVIIAARGVAVSSDLIEELAARGVRLSFLRGGGRPYAMITSPALTAIIEARREQLAAIGDERGLHFARAIVEGKLCNQERLLRYFAKYLKKADTARFESVERVASSIGALAKNARKVAGRTVDEARGALMGIEGTAGRLYWDGVRQILGERLGFPGRRHCGAADPFNSLLNYGYGILYSTVWGAVLNAGLEPFAGFLHVDRPGKPSLVLDLTEEFRQPVVDRAVLAYANLGEEIRMEGGMLHASTRDRIAERVIARLGSSEPYRGKKYQVRSIIQMQARRLASALRGRDAYRPFKFKW